MGRSVSRREGQRRTLIFPRGRFEKLGSRSVRDRRGRRRRGRGRSPRIGLKHRDERRGVLREHRCGELSPSLGPHEPEDVRRIAPSSRGKHGERVMEVKSRRKSTNRFRFKPYVPVIVAGGLSSRYTRPHPHHPATVIFHLHFSLFACFPSYGDPIMSMSMPAARRGKPKIVSTRLPLSEPRADSDGRSVRPGRYAHACLLRR
jgi:hypothetical protein